MPDSSAMTSTVTTSPDELAYDLIVYMNKLETGKDDESEYLNECKGLIEAAKPILHRWRRLLRWLAHGMTSEKQLKHLATSSGTR